MCMRQILWQVEEGLVMQLKLMLHNMLWARIACKHTVDRR